jgi:ankyrin repeat protein
MSDNSTGRQDKSEPPSGDELCVALSEGDPQKVLALIEDGADIHYVREGGYGAVIDAVHGRDVDRDPRLLELLALLVAHGANMSGVSSYGESGLRVLSRIGRFDAVRFLLEAGADERHLEWTSLMKAVALGSLADVRTLLENGAKLEEPDWWSRTAWLIAVLAGDIDKAELLLEWGADTNARGRCGRPALFYAIQGHHPEVLRWLLGLGMEVNQADDAGRTALFEAVENDDLECVEILLEARADLEANPYGTALSCAQSWAVITRLLAAGADPAQLTYGRQRLMLGLPKFPDDALAAISLDQVRQHLTPSFGEGNPQRMHVPFWEAMIRCGASAFRVRDRFEKQCGLVSGPVWCAQRFGQSLTLLPDGRAVQIGGEHEDYYDPDFCIYNDVFVHEPDGSVAIYSYPRSVFPPTDFHTATLVNDAIYVIGSLGYGGTRRYGETPVYRLDVRTLRMDRLDVRGEGPGWIYEHRAATVEPNGIRVWGGRVLTRNDTEELQQKNLNSFVLDLDRLLWSREPTPGVEAYP